MRYELGFYIPEDVILSTTLIDGEFSASRLGLFSTGKDPSEPFGYAPAWCPELVLTT
jgi:hypothetical protein